MGPALAASEKSAGRWVRNCTPRIKPKLRNIGRRRIDRMEGSIWVIRFNDGSYAVTFYPVSAHDNSVTVHKLLDLPELQNLFSSMNVTLTEEQIGMLRSTKILTIQNLSAPDDVLKSYSLI
jgi:hypothetical protein